MTLGEPPIAGSEVDTLIGSLERQRRIIEWKCGGLDAEGVRATAAASTITLGGLLKHLALVEDDYFSNRLLGRSPGPPWEDVDWDADPDWEWRTGGDDPPAETMALWRAAVARSRATTAEVLADGGLDFVARGISDPEGNAPSFRRIMIDLIEEYARHAGHADIIRESIDGLVGEDPPD
ncbi:MAG TPA: DinB family protein [Actinomycetota bacterium]|nr:DinB family protein [Actinomycetota bacterium]